MPTYRHRAVRCPGCALGVGAGLETALGAGGDSLADGHQQRPRMLARIDDARHRRADSVIFGGDGDASHFFAFSAMPSCSDSHKMANVYSRASDHFGELYQPRQKKNTQHTPNTKESYQR